MSQGRRSCTWSGHGETAQRPCARNRRRWSQGPGVTVSRGRYPCTCGWGCAVPTRTPPKVTTWSPGGDAGATPVLWLGEGFVEGRSRARKRPDWLELKPLPVVGSEETAGRGSRGSRLSVLKARRAHGWVGRPCRPGMQESRGRGNQSESGGLRARAMDGVSSSPSPSLGHQEHWCPRAGEGGRPSSSPPPPPGHSTWVLSGPDDAQLGHRVIR